MATAHSHSGFMYFAHESLQLVANAPCTVIEILYVGFICLQKIGEILASTTSSVQLDSMPVSAEVDLDTDDSDHDLILFEQQFEVCL